ncbi:MAG: zinc ABC transporter substrate-binding protein [Candidatus Jacksonbacteria bacterium]|nr:zinc ABC transporter substrate-binding protein [Candidatus Jacksonbacteria bacterium]
MKKLSAFIIVIALAVIGIVLISKISKSKKIAPASGSVVKAAASFYPLAEFAKQVGADKIDVVNITPSGMEPHDFEPSPQDIAKIYSAKIFIFNGSGFDPWAEKIEEDLKKNRVAVVNMTRYFHLLQDKAEEGADPHIWLDPVMAQKEVEIIADNLKIKDPRNGLIYEENASRYIAKLSELDKKYQDGLADCATRDAVASHAAFGYLAKRYNINITSIAGISPEEEPSPKRIAEIAEIARLKNIKYIFFETLVSPKLAETLAREIGAETLVLNPIEGLTEAELEAGKNYISIMEDNLQSIRKALVCS